MASQKMANLKGGTIEKQVKDAFHRLEAFGTSRHGKEDHLTHSDGLATKREMYLNDYKNFVEENNFREKLNQTMTAENINTFLNERLDGLKANTSENYVRGFSSMLQGLKEANITVPVGKELFNTKVVEVKATATTDTRTGLAISNILEKIERLESIRFESSVIASVQNELGLRVSESFEVVKHLEAYYNPSNGTIENLTGKGNHTYNPKAISSELVEKIRASEKIPSPNTYRNDLKAVGINNSHLLKFTYAKNEFEKKLDDGVEYHQALRELSKELNHSRESMSLFYIRRG